MKRWFGWGRKADEALNLGEAIDAGTVNALATEMLVRDLVRERISERRWKTFRRGIWVIGLLVGLTISWSFSRSGTLKWPSLGDEKVVAVVQVKGNIFSGSLAGATQVVPALRAAFERSDVAAIIVRIDSGGGAPSEAERINAAIEELREKHKDKPIVAVIESIGASAAYMIALHCDEIYAGRYSLVGSIGAIITTWDFSGAMSERAIFQRNYASGSLKGIGSPFTPPTPEGEAKLLEMVNSIGKLFEDEFLAKRSTKLKQGRSYASGEVWSGEQAKDLGLIDHVGTEDTALAKLSNGTKMEPVNIGPGNAPKGFLGTLFGDAVSTAVSTAIHEARAGGAMTAPQLQ